MKKYLLLLCLFLQACGGESVPMNIPADKSQFIGKWGYFFHEEDESSLKVSKVLLSINPDSSVYYEKCVVSAQGSNSEGTSYSSSKSLSVNLPEGILTALDDTAMTIVQKIWFFEWDTELAINQSPHKEDGRWLMEVDGVSLSRMTEAEAAELATLECPEVGGEEHSF